MRLGELPLRDHPETVSYAASAARLARSRHKWSRNAAVAVDPDDHALYRRSGGPSETGS